MRAGLKRRPHFKVVRRNKGLGLPFLFSLNQIFIF